MELMLFSKFTQKIQRGYVRVWFGGVVNVLFLKNHFKTQIIYYKNKKHMLFI